jgi:hypothetical protein
MTSDQLLKSLRDSDFLMSQTRVLGMTSQHMGVEGERRQEGEKNLLRDRIWIESYEGKLVVELLIRKVGRHFCSRNTVSA